MSQVQTTVSTKTTSQSRIFSAIERVGNKLPEPVVLFFILTIVVVVASVLAANGGASVIHPATGKELPIRSLMSDEGIVYIFTNMVKNFTGFAPLGLVLSMLIGVGLAERVGLLESVVKHTILNAPKSMITTAVVFAGIMMNIASDASMVVLPPLAALVFMSVGRNPIAGLMAGYASAGAGFTANLVIAGTDALLSGISSEAVKAVAPDITVTPIDNWYFNIVSVFVLTIVGVLVTEKIIEPKLGKYQGKQKSITNHDDVLEGRALRNAGITAVIYLAAITTFVLWPGSPLQNANGGLIPSPFLKGIIPIILFFFISVGSAYGITLGLIKNSKDLTRYMSEAISDMSSYIVLIFFCSQFIAYFNWSHLGTWIAVNGAELLKDISFDGIAVILGYCIFTAGLNFLIPSGSAKWTLEAPVFVPMFMQLGYHPAFIQLAYRVADSSTNIVTPLSPYFVVILSMMKEYDKKAGMGSMIVLLMPYTLAFLGSWLVLLLIFFTFNLPIGPGIYPML
ncbi:AbgT family transporter [Vibrio metoecus]|uniref:AbgT family transporter n=1 Tax=Vibrio metoecus TaxID=1481663 RepID=UPI00215C11D0|nr:AbgT family transporter [Vibrio metoecus]MCR9385961.1 AbgT family transporter [Vibrio metoecus]